MSTLKLNAEQRIRVTGDYKENNFIDINSHKHEIGMSIDFHPCKQYIEIRKKEGWCRQFFFEKKSQKKYFDFGYWEDAEVIFSLNEVKH